MSRPYETYHAMCRRQRAEMRALRAPAARAELALRHEDERADWGCTQLIRRRGYPKDPVFQHDITFEEPEQ